jgi:hypothetical protein
LDRPNLDAPTLQGARDNKAIWTVLIPPGWDADVPNRKDSLRSDLIQAAALSWQRAEAQLNMSTVLATRATDGAGAAALAEAQQRFYTECRRTRLALETAPAETGGAWPAGRSPLESLSDLLQKNKDLAEKRGFEPVRAAAERQVEESAGLPEESAFGEGIGRPIYARREAGEPAPGLTLTESDLSRRLTAWQLTWMWTGFLLLAALLSVLRPASALLRFFLPEQIGLVGLVGWWTVGPTWIVLGLLALAVSARLFIILVGIGQFFRRPSPDAPQSTASLPAVS